MPVPVPVYLKILKDGSLTLSVWAQPNARKSEIVGLQGEYLKVKINSPPVDGAANEAIREFLAELLEIGRSQVNLIRGDTHRQKVFRISGISADLAISKLQTGKSV